MEANEFVRAVRSNDINAMVKMPGIGKKTAERLLIEMRDRLKDWDAEEGNTKESVSASASITSDAETALISLGYKPQQAAHAIAAVLKTNPEIQGSEELIRHSLKSMA
jgi:Holliday junction DNA helicase RuvA